MAGFGDDFMKENGGLVCGRGLIDEVYVQEFAIVGRQNQANQLV
jgi:hypothetical protein